MNLLNEPTSRELALENALRDLLECFEPSIPTLFEGYDSQDEVQFVRVPPEVEDILTDAEAVLNGTTEYDDISEPDDTDPV